MHVKHVDSFPRSIMPSRQLLPPSTPRAQLGMQRWATSIHGLRPLRSFPLQIYSQYSLPRAKSVAETDVMLKLWLNLASDAPRSFSGPVWLVALLSSRGVVSLFLVRLAFLSRERRAPLAACFLPADLALLYSLSRSVIQVSSIHPSCVTRTLIFFGSRAMRLFQTHHGSSLYVCTTLPNFLTCQVL